MKKIVFKTMCFVLLIICLVGCGKEQEEVVQEALKTKSCGNYVVDYNPSLYELISGGNNNRKLLTMADISEGVTEGISILISADYSMLEGKPFPTSARDTKKILLNTASGQDTAYAECSDYFVRSCYGYTTEGNYSYFELYIVPKASANENAVYNVKLSYSNSFYPSKRLFKLCIDSTSKLLGQDLQLDYQATMDKVKNVYDKANGEASIEYDHSKDEAQTYKPKFTQGKYILNGDDFEYIDVGNDDNNILPGSYNLTYVSGSGAFNQTDYNLMSKNCYQMNKKFESCTVELEEGDRIFVSEGLTINLEQN